MNLSIQKITIIENRSIIQDNLISHISLWINSCVEYLGDEKCTEILIESMSLPSQLTETI